MMNLDVSRIDVVPDFPETDVVDSPADCPEGSELYDQVMVGPETTNDGVPLPEAPTAKPEQGEVTQSTTVRATPAQLPALAQQPALVAPEGSDRPTLSSDETVQSQPERRVPETQAKPVVAEGSGALAIAQAVRAEVDSPDDERPDEPMEDTTPEQRVDIQPEDDGDSPEGETDAVGDGGDDGSPPDKTGLPPPEHRPDTPRISGTVVERLSIDEVSYDPGTLRSEVLTQRLHTLPNNGVLLLGHPGLEADPGDTVTFEEDPTSIARRYAHDQLGQHKPNFGHMQIGEGGPRLPVAIKPFLQYTYSPEGQPSLAAEPAIREFTAAQELIRLSEDDHSPLPLDVLGYVCYTSEQKSGPTRTIGLITYDDAQLESVESFIRGADGEPTEVGLLAAAELCARQLGFLHAHNFSYGDPSPQNFAIRQGHVYCTDLEDARRLDAPNMMFYERLARVLKDIAKSVDHLAWKAGSTREGLGARIRQVAYENYAAIAYAPQSQLAGYCRLTLDEFRGAYRRLNADPNLQDFQ